MFDPNDTVVLTPPAIFERDTSRQEAVLARAKAHGKAIVNETFDLCDDLNEIYDNSYWAKESDSFENWVKHKSGLDISVRTAYYFRQISKVSKFLNVTRGQQIAAGTSKLKEIFQLDPEAKVIDEATQNEELMADIMRQLIIDAPERTVTEIKEIVKRLLGKTSVDKDSELTWMNLPVRRDAKNVVLRAIDLAKLLSGDTIDAVTDEVKDISNAMALERICADYLSDPNNTADEVGTPGNFEDEAQYDDSGETDDSFSDEIEEEV